MRKKSSASGCSAFIRWYCCMAGVAVPAAVGMAGGVYRQRGRRRARLAVRERALLSSPAVRVLAVDTSGEQGSVAVVEGGEARGEVRLRPPVGHSLTLLPAIEFLLRALGVRSARRRGLCDRTRPGVVHRRAGGPRHGPGAGTRERPAVPRPVEPGRAGGADRGRGRLPGGDRGRLPRRGLDAPLRPPGAPAGTGGAAGAGGRARRPAGRPARWSAAGRSAMRHCSRSARRTHGCRRAARTWPARSGSWRSRGCARARASPPEALRPVYLRDADARVSSSR